MDFLTVVLFLYVLGLFVFIIIIIITFSTNGQEQLLSQLAYNFSVLLCDSFEKNCDLLTTFQSSATELLTKNAQQAVSYIFDTLNNKVVHRICLMLELP